MSYQVYVGNLPFDVSKNVLEEFFAECGPVENTEITTNDDSGRTRVSAVITMREEDGANLAVARLNGAMFEGRTLRVSSRGGRSKDGGASGATKARERKARITSQFRERHNITYELDCAGSPLVVRVFPLQGEVEQYRLEARPTDAADATVASATAPSRAAALEQIAGWWHENTVKHALAPIDWEAVAQAMKAVGAL